MSSMGRIKTRSRAIKPLSASWISSEDNDGATEVAAMFFPSGLRAAMQPGACFGERKFATFAPDLTLEEERVDSVEAGHNGL